MSLRYLYDLGCQEEEDRAGVGGLCSCDPLQLKPLASTSWPFFPSLSLVGGDRDG